MDSALDMLMTMHYTNLLFIIIIIVVAVSVAGGHNGLEEQAVEVLLSLWTVVGYRRRRWTDIT